MVHQTAPVVNQPAPLQVAQPQAPQTPNNTNDDLSKKESELAKALSQAQQEESIITKHLQDILLLNKK